MKLTTNDLKEALAIAGAAVGRTSTMPILDCVLLEASGDRLRVTGSDLETEIRSTVPAEVAEPGAVSVHAGNLTNIVRNAPEGGIELKLSGSQLAIRTTGSRHRVNTLPGGDYPQTEPPRNGIVITLPAEAFGTHVAHVEHSAARDDVRRFLNGIHLACDASAITFTASDGHRLARSLFEWPPGSRVEHAPTILPVKAVQALTKTIKAGTINLTIAPDAARIENERTTVTCRRIANKYPSVDTILSARSDTCARIEADNLAAAAARAAPTAGELGGLQFSIERGRLTLTSTDSNGQESIATSECDYDGEPAVLGYCYRYLIDAANHIPGTAILHLPDADSESGAIFIRPESDVYQYGIMPLRL